jgi:tetratricopeptide (TPR) repeat protein
VRALTHALLIIVAVAPATCLADTIHLKNGRVIWGERVRENGSHIEYDVGDNSYAISKSLVERIEEGGVPPEFANPSAGTASSHADLPAFVPADPLNVDADLPDKIIHDDRVDTDSLLALERSAKPATIAAGYFIAGKHEFDRGNLSQAKLYFGNALRFQPDGPTLLNYYAAVLVRLGAAKEALTYAERSTRVAPDSADSFAVLGFVQFACDRSRDAVRSWKRSLELRPDAAIQQYVAKAEREINAEADFTERASSHFTLRYEGKQTPDSLRRALLATLESEYDDLVRELGVAPRENIAVVLYTDKAFFDITNAPSWSGAVNDGRLRIPINGMDSVTPELARVLKHELAHSFINQISHGRCPQWLHEGIAQALEPKRLNDPSRLAQLFSVQQEIPLNNLEGSFMRFSSSEAVLAYDESLAAVSFISYTYGMSEMRRILERIGEGSSIEVALRNTIHSDYGQLQTEIGKFLSDKYGR